MSSINPILAKPAGVLRPKGILFLGGCLIGSAFGLVFFGDAQLKTLIERRLSETYGARINLGSLRTNFRKSLVTAKRIQVANPYSPMKNLLEIDELEFSFLPSQLFRRKLIIPQMKVSGIHVGTQREVTGVIYSESEYPSQPQSLFDRVDTSFFSNVRATLEKNPLKQLAPISAGFYIPTRMEPYRREMLTIKELSEAKTQVESLNQQGSIWAKQIPSPNRLEELKMQFNALEETSGVSTPSSERATANFLTDIKQHQTTLLGYLKEAQEKLDLTKAKVNNVSSVLEHDLNYVKGRLNLPAVELQDLSYALFGTVFLNDLEKLLYWVNTLRQKMPVGLNHNGIYIVQQPKYDGTSFHFGSPRDLPSLWIKRIEFSSNVDAASLRGSVTGEIQNLTLDPLILGAPTTISLDADFPKIGIDAFHFEGKIDHTGASPKEWFSASMKSFPIENWIITQTSDYKLKLAKGRGSFVSEGEIDDDSVDIQWEFNVDEGDMSASSRYKMVEDTLKQLLQTSNDFSLRGRAKGTIANVDFQLQSEMGRKLGVGIADTFKQQLLTLDETLKNRIMDDLVPLRQEIFEKIGQMESSQLALIKSALDALQSLQKKTDKLASAPTQKPQVLSKRTRRLRP